MVVGIAQIVIERSRHPRVKGEAIFPHNAKARVDLMGSVADLIVSLARYRL